MGIAVRVYFRRINIHGIEKLPKDVPIVFTPNHPSAFMDPILLAIVLKKNAYFIARGESFQNKISAFLLGALRIIPIYRPDKTKHLVHKNKNVFYRCSKILSKRGSIIIFPEGLSRTEFKLRKIHTGPVRIAFAAEKEFNFSLNVHVVPIGINYTNPHKFRSDAILNIGTPIRIADFKYQYENNSVETVKQITQTLSIQLRQGFTAGISSEHARLAEKIIIAMDLGMDHPDHIIHQNFFDKHDAVVNWVNHQPEHVLKTTENEMDDFLSIANKHGIKRHSIDLNYKDIREHRLAIAWISIPFAGISNALPYWITGFATDSIIQRNDFRGSFLLTIGFWIFLFYFIILGIILNNLIGTAEAIGLVLTAIVTGFLCLPALDAFRIWKRNRAWSVIRSNNQALYESIRERRKKIIETILKGTYVTSVR